MGCLTGGDHLLSARDPRLEALRPTRHINPCSRIQRDDGTGFDARGIFCSTQRASNQRRRGLCGRDLKPFQRIVTMAEAAGAMVMGAISPAFNSKPWVDAAIEISSRPSSL